MHNFERLASDLAPFFKKGGDSGDGGDRHHKSLNARAFPVTTHRNKVSPLDLRVVTDPKSSGDAKSKLPQPLKQSVTTVTAVTTNGQSGAALNALRAARAAGIGVEISADGLEIQAPSGAPPAVIEQVRRCEADIVALLTPGPGGMTGEDWIVLFEKQAAIRGLPRREAERRAFECTLTVWRDRVHAVHAIGVCAHCGRRDEPGMPLVAYGTAEGGVTDLHSQCWPAWNAERIRCGTAFLNSLGITAAAPQEGDRAFRQCEGDHW